MAFSGITKEIANGLALDNDIVQLARVSTIAQVHLKIIRNLQISLGHIALRWYLVACVVHDAQPTPCLGGIVEN